MKNGRWLFLSIGWLGLFNLCAAERARLSTEHVDLRVVYQPEDPTNKLALVVRDDDHGVSYRSNEVALVVAESARLTLPGDLPPFGNAGEALWILPQTQDPALLYLGLSTEGMPAGVFPGELALYLRAVQGPGHVFAWQAALSGLDVRINSRDGLDDADQIPLIAGSHSHWNFGFTSNGVYELVFEVQGRRVGVETNDFSLPTPIRFEVEPLPPKPASPFARWQAAHWPGVSDEAIIGPEADPDRDRRPNRLEYAYAFDPKTPDGDGTPKVSLVKSETGWVAEITFRRNKAATDAVFRLEAAANLFGPWTPITNLAGSEDRGDYELVTLRDTAPVENTAARFYRLLVELTAP